MEGDGYTRELNEPRILFIEVGAHTFCFVSSSEVVDYKILYKKVDI